MRNLKLCLCLVCCLASPILGCGSDEPPAKAWSVREAPGEDVAYEDDTTSVIVVVGRQDSDTLVVDGDPGQDCVLVDQDCVSIEDAKGKYCGVDGAKADVVVADGEVVEVICYPPPDSGVPIEEVTQSADGSINLPQNANGAVITFDEATDEIPIEGDVALNAERAVLYGNGPDKTIFKGNLTVISNNSRVRGITVEGDLSFAKNANNAKLAFTKVYGDLKVEGNGFSAVNVEVFGDLNIDSNDITVTNIGVQGEWKVPAGAACYGCYSFNDADEDFLVADEEIGDALCPGEGMTPAM